jgi:Flp pilus assembly pilin Flp
MTRELEQSVRASFRMLVLNFARGGKAIGADQRGVAAVEFGLFAIFLSLALVNVTDVSIYIYQRMQAENATQVAVQAAWKTCDPSQLPATTKCAGLATALQNALQSTSLGARVRLALGGILLREFVKRAAVCE